MALDDEHCREVARAWYARQRMTGANGVDVMTATHTSDQKICHDLAELIRVQREDSRQAIITRVNRLAEAVRVLRDALSNTLGDLHNINHDARMIERWINDMIEHWIDDLHLDATEMAQKIQTLRSVAHQRIVDALNGTKDI